MGFTENSNYDMIDDMELDIDTDIENWGWEELLNSLVKGKCHKTIDKKLLIKNIHEHLHFEEGPKEKLKEFIKTIKNKIGIVLHEQELAV